MEVDRAGCEKLIAALEAEIERLRPEPARARKEYQALWPLARLAGVVSGHLSRDAVSPCDFGFEYDWQLFCAPALRKKREEEFREELERKRIAAAEWEAGRPERERQAAERASAAAAKQAEEARIDAFGFEDAMSFLFFDGRELTLDEIKRQATAWDHYRLIKAAVELWPESPRPDLWVAIHKEIMEISTGRDAPFRRAADRLARVLHPGSYDHEAPLDRAAQVEEREPTYHEINSLDLDGLLGFVFSGKRTLDKDAPTLKAVIEAMPDRPAAHVLQAVDNELRAIGRTESAIYNYALQRLPQLVHAGIKAPWEGENQCGA
jgi:hypothetical protein